MAIHLCPDDHLPTYQYVTPAYLAEHGIRALLLDVDNTLAPYEQPEPDEALLAWLKALTDSGIKMAVVSNNRGGRIGIFTAGMTIPVYFGAGKPRPRAFLRAMKELGVSPEETAALGDQIYTDVLAARLSKLKWVVTVPPIKDKRDLFTRFKRLCEKPVMKRYRERDTHEHT